MFVRNSIIYFFVVEQVDKKIMVLLPEYVWLWNVNVKVILVKININT